MSNYEDSTVNQKNNSTTIPDEIRIQTAPLFQEIEKYIKNLIEKSDEVFLFEEAMDEMVNQKNQNIQNALNNIKSTIQDNENIIIEDDSPLTVNFKHALSLKNMSISDAENELKKKIKEVNEQIFMIRMLLLLIESPDLEQKFLLNYRTQISMVEENIKAIDI